MINTKIEQEIKALINQFNAKNFEHVILKSKTLIKKNPQYVILYNLLGSSYQNTGKFLIATDIFKEGLKLDPTNIAITNNLAMSYKALLEYKKSEDLFKEIIKRNQNYINAYVNLGNLKRDLNKFEEAIVLYQKALTINEKNPIVLYSLALAYQGLGKFDEAISFAKKTLLYNPNFTRADNLISQSTKYDNPNEHYFSLKEKISKTHFTNEEKIELYFALAKAEEDMKNIEESSKNFILGNKLKKKISNYDVKNDLDLIENIKKTFIKQSPSPKDTNNNDNIIFILGMPRSGTSLVEQIISSHSNVFGCGELPILSKIIKENFIENNKISEVYLNDIINDDEKINKLRSYYFEFVKHFNLSEKFITDKAPLNFRWIGFIKHLFPNSKIIHCTRNSKDNCLSMYKNLFEGGLNFTYDQEDLVNFYKKYLDLMTYWKSKYNDSIFEINYEKLTNKKEEEIEKIINFCGLEMEESCLSFHKNKSPIKTMSTAQARQPIYKTSVKSFDKYKKYLSYLENNL